MNLTDDYRRLGERWAADDISPEQTELATSLRVPFVTSEHGRWNYVCSIVVGNDWPESWSGQNPWAGDVPTDDEVRTVASFIDEYRAYWYNAWFTGLMRDAAPYDIDGGANLAILRKRPEDGGWCYRKRTWDHGPRWAPIPDDQPADLVAVLDRIHTIGDRLMDHWAEWKAAHPDVFGEAAKS